jgi:hypothetical protein
MGHRFHRGFTAAEKAELWDRWKRRESLKAIGRAFGKPSSSISFLVAPHGGIRPAQRRRSILDDELAPRHSRPQASLGSDHSRHCGSFPGSWRKVRGYGEQGAVRNVVGI